MEKIKLRKPILTQEDYLVIMNNLNSGLEKYRSSQIEAEQLIAELKSAKIVASHKIDASIVRLNSVALIKDEENDRTLEVTIVTPGKADIKLKKISVLSPIGAALIGYAEGDRVSWSMPGGRKTFSILKVKNSP